MGKLSGLVGFAEKTGRRKALLGRSSSWLGVWVAAAGYRKLQDFFSEEPEIIREEIRPGEQLVITHYLKGEEPPEPVKLSRRQRRRAKAAEKQARREQAQARREAKRPRWRSGKRDRGTDAVTDVGEAHDRGS